jgi:hypothetical protein
MKVKIYLNLTTSKFLAYLIFIAGTIYGFAFKDSNVLIASWAASSAVIAAKSYTASRERQKQIEFPDPNTTDLEKPPDGL